MALKKFQLAIRYFHLKPPALGYSLGNAFPAFHFETNHRIKEASFSITSKMINRQFLNNLDTHLASREVSSHKQSCGGICSNRINSRLGDAALLYFIGMANGFKNN
jgi:hypothetical protein